jgi:CspA family cold shock protein
VGTPHEATRLNVESLVCIAASSGGKGVRGCWCKDGVVTTIGEVSQWRDEEGWGVIDSPVTPGGCWAHFSSVATTGYKALAPGQLVYLEWEAADQDGFSYRAVRCWPVGEQPAPEPSAEAASSPAYGSSLMITDYPSSKPYKPG